jgi:hypothetical protein
MDPDRETLDRFVDGELPPAEMTRIAALLVERPELEAYVRRQERLRESLRAAWPTDEAIPGRLAAAVRTAPVSLRWRLRHGIAQWHFPPVLQKLAQGGAILAAGIAIGILLRPGSDIVTRTDGAVIAQGRLAHTLNVVLAADQRSVNGPRIGISFRDKTGSDCRTFESGRDGGLACREAGAWVVKMMVPLNAEHQGAQYRMAGSGLPDALRRAVEDRIDGVPFDATAERVARDRGWAGR